MPRCSAVPREFFRQAGVVCLTILLGSCGHDKEPAKDEANGNPPKLVGRVASVPGDGGFVLIQSYGAWAVPDGEAVFSQGPDGRAANLLPTGEHLSQFVAADIRSGRAGVGDAVYAVAKGKAGTAVKPTAAPGHGKPSGGGSAGAVPTDGGAPAASRTGAAAGRGKGGTPPTAGGTSGSGAADALPPLPEH